MLENSAYHGAKFQKMKLFADKAVVVLKAKTE